MAIIEKKILLFIACALSFLSPTVIYAETIPLDTKTADSFFEGANEIIIWSSRDLENFGPYTKIRGQIAEKNIDASLARFFKSNFESDQYNSIITYEESGLPSYRFAKKNQIIAHFGYRIDKKIINKRAVYIGSAGVSLWRPLPDNIKNGRASGFHERFTQNIYTAPFIATSEEEYATALIDALKTLSNNVLLLIH